MVDRKLCICLTLVIVIFTLSIIIVGPIIDWQFRKSAIVDFYTPPSNSTCYYLNRSSCLTNCDCGWCNIALSLVQFNYGYVNCLPSLYYSITTNNPLCQPSQWLGYDNSRVVEKCKEDYKEQGFIGALFAAIALTGLIGILLSLIVSLAHYIRWCYNEIQKGYRTI